MRNRILVTAVLMVAVGGGAAESVATSPECERWIADYRQKLAQTRPVQVVEKQSGRVKRYVHRQIAEATHKPKLVRTASPRDPLRPRLSPQQMVKRFQVLCGDLPPVQTAQLLPPSLPPQAPITPLAQPGVTEAPVVPMTPGSSTPGTPTFVPPGNASDTPPVPPTQPPGGGGGGGGGTPPPPVPPVPEPSSIALVAIGSLAGAAMLSFRRTRRIA